MVKKLINKKLDNNGSTLVTTLVIVAFITVLVTVLMSASITNIAMKRTINKSKVTFYSAEAALDEVYAGIGMTAMDSFGEAYEKVASSLIEITEIGGVNVVIEVDNATANTRLKENFINNAMKALTGKDISSNTSVTIDSATEDGKNTIDYAKTYLTGYLTNSEAAKVESIGNIKAVKTDLQGKGVYTITLKDALISYINEEGFFATVTVDMEIKYPDITAGFTQKKNYLTAFSEYALISNKNINLTGSSINIKNNILANKNINIYNGSKVTCDGLGAVNIVASNDINVESNGYGSTKLEVKGCDVWCSNLSLLTSSGTVGSVLTVDNESELFVRDDLNLNGRKSTATIYGNYYGYSYEGYSTVGNKVQDKSSSIVVNGTNSKLTIKANTLMVGGHAYINFEQDGTPAYMTGETLSVKGNQDIYLVVDQYIEGEAVDGGAVKNPMSYDDWMKITDNNQNIPIDLTGFYALDLLVTDSETEKPYIIKYVNDTYYVYLNFKSKTAAAQYFATVADDDYFAERYPDATTAQKEERNALKIMLNRNLINFLGEDRSISVSGSGSIMSVGAMFEVSVKDSVAEDLIGTGADYSTSDDVTVNSGTIDTSIKTEAGYDTFALASIDYGNRFSLLAHMCLSVQEEKGGHRFIVNDPTASFVYNGETYNITGDNLELPAAENVVDFAAIKESEYNAAGKVVSGYLVMAVDDGVVVPNTAKYGLILATGDVYVSANFAGIIITQGNINITGNATITNLPINEIRGYENIKKYLFAYQNNIGLTDDRMSDISYTDIVKLSNWRKNEE